MHTAKASSITRVQLPLTGGAEAVYYFHSDHLVAADLQSDAVEFRDFKSQYATVADCKSATTEKRSIFAH